MEAHNIKIEYPQGLEAEQVNVEIYNNYDKEVERKLKKILEPLIGSVCSTSADNLNDLLDERRRQVKELENTLPRIEKILSKEGLLGDEICVSFEID